MPWYFSALIIIGTFFFMEFVAWFTHKYIMHGFLWVLHKDHHQKTPGFFEKNDAFFLIFAVPSWLCIMLGMMYQFPVAVNIGIGILVYGFAYFVVHEIFIHQRFKWLRHTDVLYFKAIRRAHKMHHKHLGKEDGESFGMILIHPKYIRQEIQALKKQRNQAPQTT
jgi:beta-carotene 3-hydroxylase